MRVVFLRLVVIAGLVLSFSGAAHAGKIRWTDPTAAELAMTSEPKAPGAPAIILSYEESDDSDSAEVMVHVRIKVLTEGGLSAANVKIPSRIVSNDEFEQLFQARTIHRDGSIVLYKAGAQNTVVREDEETSEKIVALPAAEVGSILEYGFHFASQNTVLTSLIGYYAPTWRVQGPYFTKTAHFSLTIPPYVEKDPTRWVAKLPPGTELRRVKNNIELNVQDVPAFPDEEYMPPHSAAVYNVRFFFWSKPADEFWGQTGDDVDHRWAEYYRPRKPLVAAVTAMFQPADNDEQKLRKLYAAVQGFENTDLSRRRSVREDKGAGLHEAKSSEDIWNRKRGDSEELTLLFIALARAAGYEAYPMAVASRNRAVFDENVLSWSQLDSMVAIVVVNGKEHFFDPGTRLCPFGLMAPWHGEVLGVSSEGKLMKFRSTPPASMTNFRTERRTELTLAANGGISGHVTMAWIGTAGLELRRQALREDAQAVQTSMEEEMQHKMPAGAELKLVSVKGLADGEAPLIAEFSLSGTLGVATQKRLLVPAQLFQSTDKPAMSSAVRTTPVRFPEAHVDRDQVEYHLAPQLSVETLPEPQTLSVNADTAYKAAAGTSRKDPHGVVTERTFVLKRIDWAPDEYAPLHRFFGQVATHDQDQIVLHINPVQAEAR